MSTLLYMHIPGLPSCIKLSDRKHSINSPFHSKNVILLL